MTTFLSPLGTFSLQGLREADYRLVVTWPGLRSAESFFHLSSDAVAYYPVSQIGETPTAYETRTATEEAHQFLTVLQMRALEGDLGRRVSVQRQGKLPSRQEDLGDGSRLVSTADEVTRTFPDGTTARLRRRAEGRYEGEVGPEKGAFE